MYHKIMCRTAEDQQKAEQVANLMQHTGAEVFSVTSHNGRLVVWARVKDNEMIDAVDYWLEHKGHLKGHAA